MKTFLVSKNALTRQNFIDGIAGRKIAIYNQPSPLLEKFDLAIDMNLLMKDDYFLTNLSKCDGNTTIVLIDVLIKNGIYVHPFGRIYKFCETARSVFIIDYFAFKWDERQIVRPFLFLNPNILGASLITFINEENNTIESYFNDVKEHIQMDVSQVTVTAVNYSPSADEIKKYEELKKELILEKQFPKAKIVNMLIKYVDSLKSKQETISNFQTNALKVVSNLPKNKFSVYQSLADESVTEIVFFSSGVFGADEIELKKTRHAIERHNFLIELFNGTKKIQ